MGDEGGHAHPTPRGSSQELDGTVAARRAIAYVAPTEASADASRRARNAHMESKLRSLVHMQAQEIDLLREELDRLRMRTFPSFAHVEKARAGGLVD